jgi:hypothetical protein
MVRLHRGIAVEEDCADEVISAIKAGGLTALGPGRSYDVWPIVEPGRLLEGDMQLIDTRAGGARPAVCAADALGATHYACRHNRADHDRVPLMIEFDAPLEAICVDGNDLLYRVFSRHARIEAARPALIGCYGEAILRYAERAWASDDPRLQIALCDLALWDAEVIGSHHANEHVIEGKFGTLFRSAFKVMLPVVSSAIVSVWRIDDCPPAPRADVSLDALTV